MNDLDEVRSLLAGTDPLPEDGRADAARTTEARAVLAGILSAPRTAAPTDRGSAPSVHRRSPLGLVAAAAVVALLVAGAMVVGPGGGSSPAVAATPPVLPYETTSTAPAGPVLGRIAAAAAALPTEPAAGPYRYVRTQRWALNSAVAGGRVTSVLASQQRETWRLPDGTGRVRTTAGENLVDRIGSRQTLEAALTERPASDESLASDGYVPPPLADVDRLPTGSPAEFALAVSSGANTGIPAGALVAEHIQQLFAEQPVPPQARAGIWRLLATVPGAAYRGELADRVGRRGAAITVDDDGTAHGLPARYLFIIDPATGELLEYDNILTTDPGALNVRVPAIVSLTVYLEAGRTASPTGRPGE